MWQRRDVGASYVTAPMLLLAACIVGLGLGAGQFGSEFDVAAYTAHSRAVLKQHGHSDDTTEIAQLVSAQAEDEAAEELEESLKVPSTEDMVKVVRHAVRDQSREVEKQPWRHPVVVLHGLLQSVNDTRRLVMSLQAALPTRMVLNIEIGNGVHDSLYKTMLWQVTDFCKHMKAYAAQNEQWENGFNFVGFDQGALVGRGYVQECKEGPPVHNYISLSAPQAGIFAVPQQQHPVMKQLMQNLFDSVTASAGGRNVTKYQLQVVRNQLMDPYNRWMQEHISFAQYWRDPTHMLQYLKTKPFICRLNNEGTEPDTEYAERISKLNNMVLVGNLDDEEIVPAISQWFGYFARDSTTQLKKLRERGVFLKDTLGLRKLDEDGKLALLQTSEGCNHLESTAGGDVCNRWLVKTLLPYLDTKKVLEEYNALGDMGDQLLSDEEERRIVQSSSVRPIKFKEDVEPGVEKPEPEVDPGTDD